MTVRAKFTVVHHGISQHWKKGAGLLHTITLQPVSSGSEENVRFFEATPSGKIELGTVNADVAAQLPIGSEFYVDFTPA